VEKRKKSKECSALQQQKQRHTQSADIPMRYYYVYQRATIIANLYLYSRKARSVLIKVSDSCSSVGGKSIAQSLDTVTDCQCGYVCIFKCGRTRVTTTALSQRRESRSVTSRDELILCHLKMNCWDALARQYFAFSFYIAFLCCAMSFLIFFRFLYSFAIKN
jgi:hypothetical protein